MKKIEQLEELSPMLTAQWKRGVIANASLSAQTFRKEILAGTLYVQELPEGLLLFRRRGEFDRMSFFLQPQADFADWKPERTTVLEIAVREKDTALKQSEDLWQAMGFSCVLRRVRMSVQFDQEPLPADETYLIREAAQQDREQIQELLQANYNPMTACLPTDAEMDEAIAASDVLVAKTPEGKLLGVHHTRCSGNMTECRHIAVTPEMRRRGIGESLLFADYRRKRTRRYMLWVAEDNIPARKLYEKIGYKPDGWKSSVWVYHRDRS